MLSFSPVRQVLGFLALVLFGLGVSSCAGDASVVVQQVLLVPSVNAGWAGWCVNGSGGGCPPGKARLPIVAEGWSSGGPPLETNAYAITASNVYSVSYDGRPPIRTHPDAALPGGLRSVGIEIRGRDLLEESSAIPRFEPLDAKGEEIKTSTAYERNLGVEMPIRNITDPARPKSGACRIDAAGLAGLKVGGGSVVVHIQPYPGLIGDGFLTCASTSYNLDGWPLLASVLLSASHPGSSPPPLPGMKEVHKHPGIFEAPGPGSQEDLLARRIPGAWLVVSRAMRKQRLRFLEHLRGSVNL